MSDPFRLPSSDVSRSRVTSSPRRDVRIRACLEDVPDQCCFFGAPLPVQIHFDAQPTLPKSPFLPLSGR